MPRPSQCRACGAFELCLAPGDPQCAERLEYAAVMARASNRREKMRAAQKTKEQEKETVSQIGFKRGDVELQRTGVGANTQWVFKIHGQTSTPAQELVINNLKAVNDLKAIIGQVEHAAKVLALDPE